VVLRLGARLESGRRAVRSIDAFATVGGMATKVLHGSPDVAAQRCRS